MASIPSAPESGAGNLNDLKQPETEGTRVETTSSSVCLTGITTLEKSRLDFLAFRTQTTFGLMLVAAVCIIGFSSVFSSGFLLDDFLHFDYVNRTAYGDWQPLLSNLYSNWGGSDLMKSYRPLASISILADYLIWKSDAWGYHLTNALLLAANAFFVAAITGELTGRSGNRTGAVAGIWAALLFSVYPLHAESVAWIIGRVDLLCTLFYLASVFSFLRYQSSHHRALLVASLVSFIAALSSKEMAVTLPAVIALACLLLPPEDRGSPRQILRDTLQYTALFLVFMGVFSLVRYFALATTIGGYGDLSPASLSAAIRNFLDRASLLKVLLPLNEELHIASSFTYAAVWATAAIAVLGAVRTLLTPAFARTLLFLLLWSAIALLPTFQIWHIHPNLVGSRLFFLSSAPFCMVLALCAVPSLDIVTRRLAVSLMVPGLISLLVLFLCWSWLLQLNLIPWQEAGRRMQTLRSQLIEIGSSIPSGKRVLLLDLPTDFQGAGMLTRSQYLSILTKPPLFPDDYSNRFDTLAPVGPGSHELVWPSQLRSKVGEAHQVYRWNPQAGRFDLWKGMDSSTQKPAFDPLICNSSMLGNIEAEPSGTNIVDASQWHAVDPSSPSIEGHKEFLRLYPGTGRNGLTVYCSSLPNNGREIGTLQFKVAFHPSTGSSAVREQSKVKLVWQTNESGEGAASFLWQTDKITAAPGCHRSWCDGEVRKIGLHLAPGSYYLDVYEAQPLPMPANRPTIKVTDVANRTFAFDARSLAETERIVVLVSKPNLPFDLQSDSDAASSARLLPQSHFSSEADPVGPEVAQAITLPGASGSLTLPQSVYNTAGIFGVTAVALDKSGAPIGFPAEPVTFEVISKRAK